ncbi:MAG: hypothetical protein OCC49_13290 [Fibrobacterales bacterium]
MNVDQKAEKLIVKLLQATYKDKIEWERADPPLFLIRANDDEVFLYFSVYYKDKYFSIYERRYRYYFDEDNYSWSVEIVLAIEDSGVLIWEYAPRSPALNSLFEAVREQAAGIDDILDDLLADEDEEEDE